MQVKPVFFQSWWINTQSKIQVYKCSHKHKKTVARLEQLCKNKCSNLFIDAAYAQTISGISQQQHHHRKAITKEPRRMLLWTHQSALNISSIKRNLHLKSSSLIWSHAYLLKKLKMTNTLSDKARPALNWHTYMSLQLCSCVQQYQQFSWHLCRC